MAHADYLDFRLATLVTALFFGLGGAGLAALLRVGPWPKGWLAKKPLGCIACMAGWSSLVVMVAAVWHGHFEFGTVSHAFAVWMAATGIATYLLSQTGLFAGDPFSNLTERDAP